jgi:RNA polymerase sigma-70 factor, ECF subfamily
MAAPVIADEVVRCAQRGNSDAFAAIVEQFQTPVFNYILRSVQDRGLAEDMTQEVLLRAYQSLARFSFRSKFSTWLFQIAKNRVTDEFRSRERRPRATEELRDGEFFLVDSPIDKSETIDAIWRAVGDLQLDLRTALLLRDICGFSYEEIAEIVNATLATVKWRIYQSRELVAKSVAAEGLFELQEERQISPALAS